MCLYLNKFTFRPPAVNSISYRSCANMLDMPNVLTYYDVTKDVIKLPWIYFYSSDKLHLVLCGEFFALANITFSLGS